MMAKYHHLFSLLAVVIGSWCCAAFAIAAEESPTTTCRTGWTGGSEKAIPNEWINDGYCDCPFDGKDEPDTNACSGSLFWPGVDSTSDSSDSKSTDYICPISNKILPISRLHDGICDCCDGSDEDPKHDANNQAGKSQPRTNPCPDECKEVLRAERERTAKIRKDFVIGSRKRDLDLAKFTEFRTKKVAEVSEMEKQRAAIEAEIEDIVEHRIVELKEAYAASRVAIMKDSVAGGPMASTLLTGLETEELEALIVTICQVAGEIFKSDQREEEGSDDTCLALRVAALDLGLSWRVGGGEEGSTVESVFREPTSPESVEILFQNAVDNKASESTDIPLLRYKNKNKKKFPRKGGRRLDEIYPGDDDDDDDMYLTDDDYLGNEHSHYDDDGFVEDRHHRDLAEESLQEEEHSPEKESKTVEAEKNKFIDEIQTTMFSVKRARFMKKSQEILDEIEKAFNPPEEAPKSHFNRDAYMTFRKSLEEKRKIVEMGYSWGASAKFLLSAPPSKESSMSKNEILERLVIGTIFYGQISAIQVWQMLQVVLPEYQALSQSFDDVLGETTCHSPWAGNCPPRHVYRENPEGKKGDDASTLEFQYPPPFLLEVATTFCDEEASNFGKEFAESCPKHNEENTIHDVIRFLASLESSHHLFGYAVPIRRDPKIDPFESMFEPISSLPVDSDSLKSLEETRDTKQGEQRQLSRSIESGWKEAGGLDGSTLGRDGELHSIKDQCFEIVAGKYTYELCLFKKAQQKEGSKKTGTNLGIWKAIEYNDDDDDGEASRVLKWENGAKCWNGPKRSATIYMKCGSDQKIVSADEPDTCKYIFEMESYLACDEAYKLKMGL